MSERILNGDFSSGFDDWLNGSPPFAYELDSGKAWASSPGNTTTGRYFHIKQTFAVNYEVISADIDVWYQWDCNVFPGPIHDVDGEAEFWVYLIKPDLTQVELGHSAKSGNSSGSGWLLQNEDIKAHFNQYGNYKIYLKCRVSSARSIWLDPPGIYQYLKSHGWYDNISIDVKIKKTKVVFEAVGGTDVPDVLVSKTVKEDAAAGESYSTLFTKSKLVSEAVQAIESFTKLVKKTVLEVVGASERYFPKATFMETVKEDTQAIESYSTIKTIFETQKENAKVSERLTALKIAGNLEIAIDITPLTEWTDTSKVVTQWVKEKKILN